MLPIHLFVYSCFSHMYIFLSIRDDMHISNASIFHRQLMVIHTLLMHVFYIYFLHTLAFCASIFHRQSMATHMLLLHVFYICFLHTLAFCASIFHRQSMTTQMLFMHVLYIYIYIYVHLLFVQVFFIVSRWQHTCFLCMYFWSSKHGGNSDFLPELFGATM
jgi:hypothetical protein